MAVSSVRGTRPRRPGAGAASAERVLQVLRDRIADHELLPGSKLRESDLCAEFAVSRARVREVFGSLEERGLIERIPNRGAVVTRLDPDQVFHLFDVREVLEAQAVRLATERQPPASWQDLVDLFGAASEAMIERGELETYIGHLALLRRRTVDGAGNPLLADLLDTLHDRTRVLIRRLVILPGRARAGLREHRAVLAAMRQGDAQTAERLKRDNIRGARDSFRQYQKFIL